MKKIIQYSFLMVSMMAVAQQKEKTNPEYESQLNIPFNHANYGVFEKEYYQSENTHTNVKPYLYKSVNPSFDFNQYESNLQKEKKSWAGRKLWNEHLVEVRGKNYWLNVDFLVDVNGGIDNTDVGTTLQNTRIIKLQGQLGSNFSYSATAYENQAKFTEYIRDYAKINQPEDASGLIPGQGKSKGFGEEGFDYGVSTGYISYDPSEFFNIQFGHGKNFIGDGYRSMFLSDVSSPNTYAKLTTTVGKVQYTNIWTWLRDFNFTIDNNPVNNAGHKRKYGTFHHLSWNVTPKLNLAFFEGIISDNSGTSGAYNAEYLNPIIFYKNIEFANGEDAGSGVVGISTKVNIFKNSYVYGQFLLDEFTAEEFFTSDGYWGNKYALQLGAKFYDAFKVKGLQLQAEFNKVKPFTYSHEEQHNYAHFGQPLAHLWGANFFETVLIARYNKNRWGVNSKFIFGEKGFDITGDTTSYGGNIFETSASRNGDRGHEDQQGNKATIIHFETEVSYLINPANNLKVYASALVRNFKADSSITRVGINPESTGVTFNTENTSLFTFGIKADLFNNYRDY